LKSIFRFTSIIFITTILITSVTSYANNLDTVITTNAALKTLSSKVDIDKIKFQQLKAQVKFFQQALDEFGASTPEQVVKLWTKAHQTRNGVFQYAVACQELKDKIIKERGKPQEKFWIIGGSSPSLDKYKVVHKKKLNDSSYEIKIKYYWTSPAGKHLPTQEILIIEKHDNIWCVKAVK